MANLAKIIMEGAGFSSSSVDMGDFDYSATALEESSYVDSAMATLFTDIMEAEQGFMVADIIGTATVIREQAAGNDIDSTAILEGVVGNGIARIKAAFQKFIAKIKEFYKKVIDWFKAMFSNAENFVKNFGTAVKDKARKAKGFKYTGFKYTLGAGDSKVASLKNSIDTKMKATIGGFDYMAKGSSTSSAEFKAAIASKVSSSFKEDDVPSASEVVDDYISTLGYSDIDDMRNNLTEDYRDGSNTKTTIVDFEGNSVDSMLKFLKDSKKTISDLETDLKKYEDRVGNVIQKLNKYEAAKGADGAENIVSNASYISSVMTSLLNLYKVPCNVQIAIKKAVSKEWLSALKKFYNYKATKESVEVYDDEAYATLENSIILEADCEDGECEEPAEEGCGGGKKKKDMEGCSSTKEACSESAVADILEMASRYTF